jgi:hypothetical protein
MGRPVAPKDQEILVVCPPISILEGAFEASRRLGTLDHEKAAHPLPIRRKGPSAGPDFYFGPTGISGRFTEGLLLRRVHGRHLHTYYVATSSTMRSLSKHSSK